MEIGKIRRKYEKVFVCSGHMIDRPGRVEPRFRPELETAVREQIAGRLEECRIGPSDLALCGGACGADILFAEESVKRRAKVRLMIPLPLQSFIPDSVSFAGPEWIVRLNALMKNEEHCEVVYQHEQIGPPPPGVSPFTRNNIWQLEVAQAEHSSGIIAILVWDEMPMGDGPGGTSDFANRVRALGGVVHVINPLKLEMRRACAGFGLWRN